jgi:hypothetical protein
MLTSRTGGALRRRTDDLGGARPLIDSEHAVRRTIALSLAAGARRQRQVTRAAALVRIALGSTAARVIGLSTGRDETRTRPAAPA